MHAENKHMNAEKTNIISEAGKAWTGVANRGIGRSFALSKAGAVATCY
jgi:hypothetical protein